MENETENPGESLETDLGTDVQVHVGENNANVFGEIPRILKDEGIGALFLGLQQRLLYTGLANGIRLAGYGTFKMDLMMKSLDSL